MISTIKLSGAVLALSAALLITACTNSDPVRVEQDFSKSVRNTVKAQTYNPEAFRYLQGRGALGRDRDGGLRDALRAGRHDGRTGRR